MAEAILNRIATGDSTAVQDCLKTYGGLVWSLARRMLRNSDDAEDVVQEIFVDIWKNAERFDASQSSETTFVAMTYWCSKSPKLAICSVRCSLLFHTVISHCGALIVGERLKSHLRGRRIPQTSSAVVVRIFSSDLITHTWGISLRPAE